jgi:hypothetical protein
MVSAIQPCNATATGFPGRTTPMRRTSERNDNGMQGLVLQLTRAGFLLLLWVFIWSVLNILLVTEGALTGTRITLGTQPILIGRADDSTVVLTDDYASTRHARLSPRGSDWYVEDLGSTNGTYLDREKVTTALRVPQGTPVRIGKTVIELRS